MSDERKTQPTAHARRVPAAPPTREDWAEVWREARHELRRIVRVTLVRIIERTGGNASR